jgi:hypothetical protein
MPQIVIRMNRVFAIIGLSSRVFGNLNGHRRKLEKSFLDVNNCNPRFSPTDPLGYNSARSGPKECGDAARRDSIRLLKDDEEGRKKQLNATYTFLWWQTTAREWRADRGEY